MWKRFGSMLRCSLCAGDLKLEAYEISETSLSDQVIAQAKQLGVWSEDFSERIQTGLLTCIGCATDFPVFRGLPIMLPYQTLQHEEFRQKILALTGEDRKFKFASASPVPGERFVMESFSTEWLAYDFDGVIWEMNYSDHEKRFLCEIGEYRPRAGLRRRFLEVGCGIGLTTEMAQRNFGIDAVGIDLSLAALRASESNKENPFLHFAQASVFCLPFAPGEFETIYSRGVLHHTYSTELAFLSLARHVCPGGGAYLWVYGPRSIRGNVLRRVLFSVERLVRRVLRGKDSGFAAVMLLNPLACTYLVFNWCRRLLDPTIQPYNFKRAMHAARDRFTPEFAHRHSESEVVQWFKAAGLEAIEVVDWRVMPTADHADYGRNTGVRGRMPEASSSRPVVMKVVAPE